MREQKIAEIRQKHAMHVYDGYEDNVHNVIGFLLSELAQAENKATSKQTLFLASEQDNMNLRQEIEGLRNELDIQKERNRVARDEVKKLREERDKYKSIINECDKNARTAITKQVENEIELLKVSNALSEKLLSAQQEIERLKTALHTQRSYDASVSEMHKREQRLIEALREIEDESSQEDACITRINGIAQDILQEIGVTDK